MLAIEHIHQYYGGSHLLRDVSLTAQAGQITVLLGRNGVGKTTLLKALMGLVPLREGSITFNGQLITQATPYERARAGIGYVPQGREIFNRLTVEDNLRMGLATQKAGTPIPNELFEMFPILDQMRHRRGGDLSGGQQQRAAIIRSIAVNPRLLLLDEVTSARDPVLVNEVLSIVRDLKSDGMTMVLATHEMGFATQVADEVCFLESGNILERGSAEQVLKNPSNPKTQEFLKRVHQAGRL